MIIRNWPLRRSLGRQGRRFRKHLNATRTTAFPACNFQWYPYDSLVNLYPVDRLLHQAGVPLKELIRSRAVLDLGCADGDLAFFLESQGYRVYAVDFAPTNFNGMRGVRAMKGALQSSIQIWECDLDSRFELPPEEFGLVFFLGTLYHLKNPFYALEAIAKESGFCLLGTRVAQLDAARKTDLRSVPVAYLLEAGELNDDATNFWIFSQAGLERLVQRCGWEVCAQVNTGCLRGSDPVRDQFDERVFMLLRSRLRAPTSDS